MIGKEIIKMKCCICGCEINDDFGNNPEPVMPGENDKGELNRCCDMCNSRVVIPARVYIHNLVMGRVEAK